MVTDRDRSVVAWVAVIGAVSAQDVMARFGVGRTVGYRRLGALVDHGLLSRVRLVYGQPALYVATADGVAFAGIGELDPARVNEASVRHWALCARLAVVLAQRERCEVWGEPRLRAAERQAGQPVASAQRGTLPDGRPRLRRPDLVLFPDAALPVAVEVELSVKAARAACRRSAGRGRAAGSSQKSATTRRRTSRVPFPVPFPPCTRTTPSGSCRSTRR